jgi:hypothetical protein
MQSEAMKRSGAISIELDEIRARVDAVLAELPDLDDVENGPAEANMEEIARRLSKAHDMLVQALESAEKG